jgi:hypothetical protein
MVISRFDEQHSMSSMQEFAITLPTTEQPQWSGDLH